VREGIPQCLRRDLIVRLERGGWLVQLNSSATRSLDADAPGLVTLAHVKHEWYRINRRQDTRQWLVQHVV
jgi:hypothetical protein